MLFNRLSRTSPSGAPLRIRLDRAATIRALAISAVVLYHSYTTAYGGSWAGFELAASRVDTAMRGLVRIFFFAVSGLDQFVTIFFLLSGYFVHRAYQRSRAAYPHRSLRTFAKFFVWRRFWRLVPPFWVALLFSYFVNFDHPFSWDGLRKLLVNATLLKTLYPGYFFSINYAHWYVAVQWQLDLLYPLFLYIVVRRSIGLATTIACLAALLVTFVAPHFTGAPYILYLPFRWCAEWSFGVYLEDRHSAGIRVFRWPFWIALAAAAALLTGFLAELYVLQWIAVRVLLASLLEGALLSRSPRLEVERRLVPVGICSYALYLYHLPIQTLVIRGIKAAGGDFNSILIWCVFAATSFILAFGVAWLSSHYIEKKSSAMGIRLWRKRFVLRYHAGKRLSRLSSRRHAAPKT